MWATLLRSVIFYALAQLLAPPPPTPQIDKPKPKSKVGEERGLPLYDVHGTAWVEPISLWEGDFDVDEITESQGKK